MEFILEIEVPDQAYHHPIIASLREIANDIICWGNVSGFSAI